MVKFGVSSYSISKKVRSKEMTPEQAVIWLVEQGCDVIEISSGNYDLSEDLDLAKRLRDAAGDAGICNYCMGGNFLQITREEYETEIEKSKKHIDAGHAMGVKSVRFDSAAYNRPPESLVIEVFNEELPIIIKAYQTLCDYAAPLGIDILMENHGFHVNGSERVRAVVKSVQRDNFGHLLDVGNYACVDEDCVIATNRLLPFARHIHVKDFYIRTENPGDAPGFPGSSWAWFKSSGGRFLRGSIVGQGDVNLRAIFKSIKQSNYSGNICLEFEGIEDCLYGTKVGLENAKRLYEEA